MKKYKPSEGCYTIKTFCEHLMKDYYEKLVAKYGKEEVDKVKITGYKVILNDGNWETVLESN
jgi:hypothetical protein